MKNVDIVKNKIVKKHNDLLKAKSSLSSTAQKMLLMLVSMIRIDDTDFQEYALKIEDYEKAVGTKSNNIEFIKFQAMELMSNPFWIDSNLYNWCSKVNISKIDGYIIFDIHKDLKKYLLQLNTGNFTQYQLINILKLKGDYTPRLYEYCIFRYKAYIADYKNKYNKIAKSYKFKINLETLKERCGLIYYDIKNKKHEKKYRYNDIKKRILEVAKKQFKEHTNILFDYEEIKLGRKIESIIILISDNNQGSNNILINVSKFVKALKEFYQEKNFLTLISHTSKDIQVKVNSKNKDLYIIFENKIINLRSNQSIQIFNLLYDYAKNKNIIELEKINLLQNNNIDLLLDSFCNIEKDISVNKKFKYDYFIGSTFKDSYDDIYIIKKIFEVKNSDKLIIHSVNDMQRLFEHRFTLSELINIINE